MQSPSTDSSGSLTSAGSSLVQGAGTISGEGEPAGGCSGCGAWETQVALVEGAVVALAAEEGDLDLHELLMDAPKEGGLTMGSG